MKGIIGLIFGVIVLILIFNLIRGFGKYEGRTAEEWYVEYANKENEYQGIVEDAERAENIRACVDTEKENMRDVLATLGVCAQEGKCDLSNINTANFAEGLEKSINQSISNCYIKYFE